MFEIKLAEEILKVTREQIKIADQKASILLAGLTSLIGIEAANLDEILFLDATERNYFLLIHFIFLSAAFMLLVCSIIPRRITTKKSGASPTYFADINFLAKGLSESDKISKVKLALSADEAYENGITHQMVSVSKIVERKFRLIQWAIGFIAVAALTIVIPLINKAL